MKSSAACVRCEQINQPDAYEAGTLHLRLPLRHSVGKVLAYCKQVDLPSDYHQQIVSVPFSAVDGVALLEALMTVLSVAEQNDTRVIFQASGHRLELHDYFGACSLPQFLMKVQSGWLVEMLREDRLTMLFQPIVTSRSPHQVFAYECLLRGLEDGKLVAPQRLLDVARGADLLFQLDLAARKTALREAAAFGICSKIFINFSPAAIYDPAFCLRSTVRTLEDLGLRYDQVVFEVIESDHITDIQHLKSICTFYREKGFGVALDDLGSGYSGLNMLHELRPDYVKLDMQLVRNVHRDAYKAMITQKLLETAQALGVITVAEGIETVEEYLWLRDHGADLLQGYFIARPASPPPLLIQPEVVLRPASVAA